MADAEPEFDVTQCGCNNCRFMCEVPSHSPPEPELPSLSEKRTPWAVRCVEHGTVYLTMHGYNVQLNKPDNMWRCPRCGEDCRWDDDNYEEWLSSMDHDEESSNVTGDQD